MKMKQGLIYSCSKNIILDISSQKFSCALKNNMKIQTEERASVFLSSTFMRIGGQDLLDVQERSIYFARKIAFFLLVSSRVS